MAGPTGSVFRWPVCSAWRTVSRVVRDLLRPMLASLTDAPLVDPELLYEPKYDGIRAIAEIGGPVSARRPDTLPQVRLWSRLGNDKTGQFPEIVKALQQWAKRLHAAVVLDGEIVALDGRGDPAGFQQLQGRVHEKSGREGASSVAFIAFDLLSEGRTDLRDRPLTQRRAALERLFGPARSSVLRISESVRGDGRSLYRRALDSGWEGLIAKHADSRYQSGKRTPDWRKLKIVHEQEFVIGGWTEPRQTRENFGALLVGVYEDPSHRGRQERAESAVGPLVYVGHAGTGFNEAELARVMKRLRPLETTECPFRERPKKTNERAHWVQPKLVAQIKFTEWTADGKLRHPVYLGLRDDKKPEDVRRERVSRLDAASGSRLAPGSVSGKHEHAPGRPASPAKNGHNSTIVAREARLLGARSALPERAPSEAIALIDQLTVIETGRRDGTLLLPDGDRLSVTNLHKVFWPGQKLTKGDLLRYYVQAAPFLLPAVNDRPLVMKRLPNGIAGQPFYQHRAPDRVPPGVRVEHVPGDKTVPSRFIGGNLKTLLHMTQLAAISQDPWFSRVGSPGMADYAALDLDPPPGVPFGRVLDVARWIRDELASIGAAGVPKTSGADGLHVYIPLPPDTPYEAGLIFCQIIATVVAQKHPKIATVERMVRARGARVYIDYLQNIPGKTLATAYSARASDYAGVSTPLTWAEVDKGVRREAFTIATMPARMRSVGDLWKALRTSKGVDLSRVSKYGS
jgi:bifunctional non-homologous end joining protein LigD